MSAYDNDPRVVVVNCDGTFVEVTSDLDTKWAVVLSDRRNVWDAYSYGSLVRAASGMATLDDAVRALIGDPR